jgi:hypothetical protein
MSVHAATYRFSVAEYEKLGEAGIFHEDDRVELLNGEIILLSRIDYGDAGVVRRLSEVFIMASEDRYLVDSAQPVRSR